MLTSWSHGHMVTAESIAHSARVASAVAQHADERRNRALVAAGLLRGHFGPGGALCVGHFAPEHDAAVGQLEHAAGP